MTLVVLHSVGVGLVLLFLPAWALRLGGWESTDHHFFVRQGGAFHLVVATGYALDYWRHRSTDFMLAAKTLAVVFLVLTGLTTPVPTAVPLAAVGDLIMLALLVSLRRSGAAPVPSGGPLP